MMNEVSQGLGLSTTFMRNTARSDTIAISAMSDVATAILRSRSHVRLQRYHFYNREHHLFLLLHKLL